MKIGLISDIHSNFDALCSVLDYGQGQGVDQYICLGDVVGYGADFNPCCDLLRQVCSATLMGNHDAAVIGMMDTEEYLEGLCTGDWEAARMITRTTTATSAMIQVVEKQCFRIRKFNLKSICQML